MLHHMIETDKADRQQERQLACILSVIAAVAVAMPLMRCMKFSAMRSATKIDRALPLTVPNIVPDLTWSPSFPVHCTDKHGSTVEKTCAKRLCQCSCRLSVSSYRIMGTKSIRITVSGSQGFADSDCRTCSACCLYCLPGLLQLIQL